MIERKNYWEIKAGENSPITIIVIIMLIGDLQLEPQVN